MNRIFSYLLYAAAGLMLFTACSDDNKTPDEGGGEPVVPEPEMMTFQVDIETTSRRIDIDITPSKDDQYYFASYMSKSLYDDMGYADHQDEFKAFWIGYLEDYVSEDRDLSFYLWKGFSSQTFDGLNALPGQNFVLCVFGIEPDFKYTTDIYTEAFSTKPYQGTPVEGVTFDISLKQTTSFGGTINYKVSGPEVTWISFLQTKANFDTDYEGNATRFLTAERNRFDQTLISQGRTWSNYLRTATDFDEQWDILDSNTEYVIVAAGISEDGAIITDPSEPFFFTTKKTGAGIDIVQETAHFRFSITNLTSEKCRWTVEPLATPGETDYMYAEGMPLEGYPDMTGSDDLTQFGAVVTDIFNREICREFWFKPNPDQAMYLEAFELYFWRSFVADIDGSPMEYSFRDWSGEGYDMTKPNILIAFPVQPQTDFDWSTFDWDNEVIPHATFGPAEYIEFTAPTEEPEPANLSLPADLDPDDRFVYYRILGQ